MALEHLNLDQLRLVEEIARREAAAVAAREATVIAKETADRRLRKYVRSATAGFLIVLAGAGYGLHTVDQDARTRDKAQVARQQALIVRQQARLDAAVGGSCKRVNVLRAQSNLSDGVSFVVLTMGGDGRFSKEAQQLRVTPLTDCRRAVRTPAFYRTPTAGPLGDPKTGKLRPKVARILRDSAAYLKSVS